jgi:hypothetical protein
MANLGALLQCVWSSCCSRCIWEKSLGKRPILCLHKDFWISIYKHIERQQTSLLSQQHPVSQDSVGQIAVSTTILLCREMQPALSEYRERYRGSLDVFLRLQFELTFTARLSPLASNYLRLVPQSSQRQGGSTAVTPMSVRYSTCLSHTR